MGFFTITGMATPRNASAMACTEKGFTVVRAPIHNISTSFLRHSSTCWAVATSTVVKKLKRCFTSLSHNSPFAPTPSKEFGRVRGFQIPDRNTVTRFNAARPAAV